VIHPNLSGVARGGGWQHLGAYVNLGAFYLVGLPVALFFGFAMQLRGMGFVFGMIAGGATQVILLSVITATTDWEKMVSYFSILSHFYSLVNQIKCVVVDKMVFSCLFHAIKRMRNIGVFLIVS
jgi:hypothetical protein